MTVHRNVRRDAVKILKTKSRQIFSTSTSKMGAVEPLCGCYDKSTEETTTVVVRKYAVGEYYFSFDFSMVLKKMSIRYGVKRPVGTRCAYNRDRNNTIPVNRTSKLLLTSNTIDNDRIIV